MIYLAASVTGLVVCLAVAIIRSLFSRNRLNVELANCPECYGTRFERRTEGFHCVECGCQWWTP